MLMFRPTVALEGPVARSYFDGTWPWQCAVVFCLLLESRGRDARRGRGHQPRPKPARDARGSHAIHLAAYAGMIDPRLASTGAGSRCMRASR